MASLTGSTIAESYEQLLCLPDGGGNTSNLVAVTDGDGGTTFCISLTDASTGKAVLAVDGSHANGTEIQIDNSATDGDAFLSFQLSGTSKFTMGVDDGDSDKFKIGTTAIGTGTMFALDSNSKISLSNNDSGGAGGFNSTTGNTTFGYLAGNSIASGGVNSSMVGHQAGTSTSTGDYNVYMGARAGNSNTIGNHNVGLGAETLNTDDVGDGSVAVGLQALYSQNSDSNNERTANTAVGFESSFYNVTGQNNTAIGYQSMKGESGNSHGNNTAVGSATLKAITDGGFNTVLGAEAGEALTTGDENVFIGLNAGDSTTDVDRAVIIGANAGGGVMDDGADGTVAVGYSALGALTTGAGNVAIGYQSGISLVEGRYNVVLGHLAFDAGEEDSQCVAIGYEALTNADVSNTGSPVSTHNTAVGFAAGDVVTTGDKNTLIGSATDPSANSGTNQTVIGFSATGQADNSVTLGDENVTDVYMAEDSGAKVRCGAIVANQSADTYAAEIYGTAGAASVVFINKASSGTYITWGTGGVAKGTISESGGNVSYGAFTAHHDAELPSSDNDDGYPYGTLVETTEIDYTQEDGVDSERGIVYKVQKSSSAYAKNVLGSYSDKYPTPDYPNLHRIYVLGDGHILCNGEKGNISVGDGICTSSTDGEGMKADKMAMIIGIAQEDVSFSGSESKLVAVQYGLQQFTPW